MNTIVPGERSPRGFYLRYGFESTGEWLDHEQVLRLPVATLRAGSQTHQWGKALGRRTEPN